MEQSIQTAVKSIQEYIEKRDTTQLHLVFFNRHGEVEFVSGGDWESLTLEAQALSGGPHFDILDMSDDGRLITGQSVDEYQNSIGDDVLRIAIEEADDAREIFYSERAKEFGSDAYPKGAAAGK